MKHGKKPSYNQRKLIQQSGLDPQHWLVVKDTSKEILLLSKEDKQTKSIPK